MDIKILLLSIFNISFSSFCLSQSSDHFNIEGTWSNSFEVDGMGKHGQTLVISRDSILIKRTDDRGAFSALQLLKYKVFQDTLIGTEIEFFKFNSNIGFIEEHYKNRQSVVKIPICTLRNDCAAGLTTGFQGFRKESNEHKISWDFSAWLKSDAEKWPGKMKKDY